MAFVKDAGPVGILCPDGFADCFFEFGSLTKTLTATLLSVLVCDQRLSLETTVGEVLDARAGNASNIPLVELATHTSGLPRLAPNSITVPFWPRDPYRFYTEERLFEALSKIPIQKRGTYGYSNLGYMLLGFCLAEASGMAFDELLKTSVLIPAGMTTARCQPCGRDRLVRGYGSLLLGGRRWHHRLAGAGGVDGTVRDLGEWIKANLNPNSTPLEEAVNLAQQVHASPDGLPLGLGWRFRDSTIWHNGATGSFQAVLTFEPGKAGVGGLASAGPSKEYALDSIVLEWFQAKISGVS